MIKNWIIVELISCIFDLPYDWLNNYQKMNFKIKIFKSIEIKSE
jgi:hypothetical protein